MALKYIEAANRVLADFSKTGYAGEKLPPASVLCRRYRVSYATMHKALQLLAARNILRRASRRGTVLTAEALKTPLNIMRARKNIRLASVFSERVNAALNELLQKFCARQQNVTAEIIAFDRNGFETRREFGTAPDLLLANEWMVRQYLTDSRLAANFLPIAEISGFYWEPDEYQPTAVRACRNAQGELMALPLNVSPVVSCRNLQYSRTARHFSSDCSMEEFARRLRTFQVKGAGYRSYPFLGSGSMNRWPIFVRNFGGEIFSEDGRRCLLDQPDAVRAVEFLADLTHVKHLCCLPLVVDARLGLGDLFASGHFLCAWMTRSMFQKDYAFRLGFTPVPHGRKRTTHLRLDAIMLPRASESLTLVRELLHFLLMPENQLFLSARTDGFSGHRKIGRIFCSETARRYPGFDVFFDELAFAEPVVSAPRQLVVDYVYRRMQMAWLGVEPPAQVCRQVAAEATRMLQD